MGNNGEGKEGRVSPGVKTLERNRGEKMRGGNVEGNRGSEFRGSDAG